MTEIKLLDCTLRDGGYVNDWNFGKDSIVNIFERLVDAGVDIIEVGFIDQNRTFDKNRSIQPTSNSYTYNLGHLDKKKSLIVGMIDYGTCPIETIEDANESYLDGIRVIFKKAKKDNALEFCKELIKKGYKVFIQAVSVTSYSDNEYVDLMKEVNIVNPYAFAIVDTYGLLQKEGLLNYFDIADKELNSRIKLGYHSHNNFQLAYSNCIEMLKHSKSGRSLFVDGSVFGMGKGAGNAPTELLAMYLNNNYEKKYDISQILELIDITIYKIFQEHPWGYSMKLFLAASNSCHPNYVTKLMDKNTLSVSGINEILKIIPSDQKLDYNAKLIEELYIDYQSKNSNLLNQHTILSNYLKGKEVLLIGPGNSIKDNKDSISDFIDSSKPTVISINFIPEFKLDYIFISNSRRYVQISAQFHDLDDEVKTIATSNIRKTEGQFDFILDYSSYLDNEAEFKDNALLMALKLLKELEVKKISLAGFDGYTRAEKSDYIHPSMSYSFSKSRAVELNVDTVSSLSRNFSDIQLYFVTKSLYTLSIKDLLRNGRDDE